MQNIYKIFCIACLLSMQLTVAPIYAQENQPTPYWLLFYGGDSKFRGTDISAGTKVRAYDPDGVLCGETTVTQLGTYGFLACYLDDPNTVEDEGMVPGDTVHFTLGGHDAGSITAPDDINSGQRFEFDLDVQPCIDGYEPDHAMSYVGTITGPERHTFSSEKDGWDQDWVKFESKANWTYQIKARSSQPLSITQPVLRLFDANGTLVAENDLDKWERGAEIWWWNSGGDQDIYIQVTEAHGHYGCHHYTLMLYPWSPDEMQAMSGQ